MKIIYGWINGLFKFIKEIYVSLSGLIFLSDLLPGAYTPG